VTTIKTRLNMRVSESALAQIREAARLQDQDVTAFVLGAAMADARRVLLEDRYLRLTPQEVLQLEAALEADVEPSARLIEAVRRSARPSA